MARRSLDLALISTFAAFIAVCSLIAVTVGVVPVPITLQTFAVLLTGLCLGPRRGFLAVCLYLVVGFAGLPVFAGGNGGLGAFASPSLGYLLSFPFAAAAAGYIGHLKVGKRPPLLLAGAIAATLLTYAAGIPVMAYRAQMQLADAFWFNNAFLPFDSIKLVLAVVTAAAVLRAFPVLLDRTPTPELESGAVPA